ncbi:hypothetical protein chiPu_0008967 [Chiloscyllium punctatum]|uniref:Uncharacterized protein n=1 Tax=Chiloscyllium punctatum TaxID=137246 RepID=A0A401SJC4_CHIPU|nr:hypothetical protein [Chiloscyllium punctatum]
MRDARHAGNRTCALPGVPAPLREHARRPNMRNARGAGFRACVLSSMPAPALEHALCPGYAIHHLVKRSVLAQAQSFG